MHRLRNDGLLKVHILSLRHAVWLILCVRTTELTFWVQHLKGHIYTAISADTTETATNVTQTSKGLPIIHCFFEFLTALTDLSL